MRVRSPEGAWGKPATPAPQHYKVLGPAVAAPGGEAALPLNGFDHLAFLVLGPGGAWRHEQGPRSDGQLTTIPALAIGADGTWYVATTHEGEGRRSPVVWHRDAGGAWDAWAVTDAADAVMPWLLPARGGVVATYYAAEPAQPASGLPPPLGQAAVPPRWSLRGRLLPDGAEVDLTGTIHEGGICTLGEGCTAEDWRLRDYVQTAVAPSGRLAVAYPRDAGAGVEVMAAVSR